MKKRQPNNFTFYLFTFTFLVAMLFPAGCGVVSIMGTPTSHETKKPAEYNITNQTEQKILILVRQSAWIAANINLRYHLTESISGNLIQKAKILPESLVSYSELSKFRSSRPDFPLLSPVEAAKALDADLVLFVTIENYQLGEIAASGYYKGYMVAQATLFKVADGTKLWPVSADNKVIKVGFDLESGGKEVAVIRLTNACAYCTVRYLFNCPVNQFKISDDKSGMAWQKWD